MAATDEENIRVELRAEREQLAEAVDELRGALGRLAGIAAKLRSKRALGAGGALALGFLKAGGVGTTARLLKRRGRRSDTKAAAGRFGRLRRR